MRETLAQRRHRLMGPNLPTFYDTPLHAVKGQGVWLWDDQGRKYLDCYNNVPHVGHCHPHVVDAIAKQAATLNTHTRYHHNLILDYIERLTASFDKKLSTAILTCTGSEANDIALRIAQAVTGKRGIIATDYTYHGNTTAVSALSQSNHTELTDKSHVRFVPAPDSYRPLGGVSGQAHAQAFANAVRTEIDKLNKTDMGFGALIICPYFVNEGFPDLPKGWLDDTIKAVHNAGGVVIADEVQPGFGRLGSQMWGHQYQGFTPDIVTLGKPMANGHPVGGVITSPDFMAAFRSAFRYFNTFGGNPVSCAAAMAVLDVLEEENLLERAKVTGQLARDAFDELGQKYEWIGDVRGRGLLFGAELVVDRNTKEPATQYTDRLINMMREEGIILSKLGRYKNALKIRPPMAFGAEHLELLVSKLDYCLDKLGPADG